MSAASIYAKAQTVVCPKCNAPVNHRCLIVDPRATVGPALATRPHQARLDEANKRKKP